MKAKRFKATIKTIILCIIPLSALAVLLYCLETYHEFVHSDSAAFVCGYAIAAFLVSTILWNDMRKNRFSTAIWIASTVILAFVLYTGSRIPFCVECDQVTAEDLGFLTHWIHPGVE